MSHGSQLAVIVLFAAAMWAPLVWMFLGFKDSHPNDERRILAQMPRFVRGKTWSSYATGFTAYFHDHFGLRNFLIATHALLRVKGLGVTTSREVVLGKDGWLFYAGDKSMEDYRGTLPFTDGELNAWVELFRRRQEWFTQRAIFMLVVITPDKQSIYPDLLPSSVKRVRDKVRLDQLMAALPPSYKDQVLDLRGPLLAAKVTNRNLYYRTDSHWTSLGAYTAYLAIVEALSRKFPEIQPLPLQGGMDESKLSAGDLAAMLGLGALSPELPKSHLLPGSRKTGKRSAVIIGDSFMPALNASLAGSFERMVAIVGATLPGELIEREQPDIVIFEFVQRKLNGPVPIDIISPARSFQTAPYSPAADARHEFR